MNVHPLVWVLALGSLPLDAIAIASGIGGSEMVAAQGEFILEFTAGLALLLLSFGATVASFATKGIALTVHAGLKHRRARFRNLPRAAIG
jgi:hypothetical protein